MYCFNLVGIISVSVALLYISISGAVVEKRCIAFHEFSKDSKTVTRYSRFLDFLVSINFFQLTIYLENAVKLFTF